MIHLITLFILFIGVDYGLQLTLNIEQYEYMLGPFHSAGVRIYLHDVEEAPLVRCLGQAVPPGTHAVIALSYMVVSLGCHMESLVYGCRYYCCAPPPISLVPV